MKDITEPKYQVGEMVFVTNWGHGDIFASPVCAVVADIYENGDYVLTIDESPYWPIREAALFDTVEELIDVQLKHWAALKAKYSSKKHKTTAGVTQR